VENDPSEVRPGLARSAASPVPAPFAVSVDLVTGGLRVTGRLDARTTHLVYDAVSALLTTAHRGWVIDVSDLVVADQAGLRALAGCYRRALRSDRRITLLGASPALRSALTRLRLERHALPPQGSPTDGGRLDACS
jgi:anti-anti-sigma factor